MILKDISARVKDVLVQVDKYSYTLGSFRKVSGAWELVIAKPSVSLDREDLFELLSKCAELNGLPPPEGCASLSCSGCKVDTECLAKHLCKEMGLHRDEGRAIPEVGIACQCEITGPHRCIAEVREKLSCQIVGWPGVKSTRAKLVGSWLS